MHNDDNTREQAYLHECDLSSTEAKGRRQCCVPTIVSAQNHQSLLNILMHAR